jgi:hypothetical protein
MNQSKSLFYLYTKNSQKSRWMPWELGYFDGFADNVAILPTQEAPNYRGEEYLGLYPYVDVTGTTVWIHRNSSDFKLFEDWRREPDKLRPQ